MEEQEHSTSPEIKPRQAPKEDFWSFTAELIKTAVIISFLAYVIRIFVLQPFIVEGLSMYPQFKTSDYLLVDKVSYRLSPPHRGDIVVFKYPGDPSINYVKRVIGLPGEKIHIENGHVTVINIAHPQGELLNELYVSSGNLTSTSTGPKADYTVPSNNYFVLGDNRQASSDSREWGFLPSEDLIGRVLVQAFPLNRISIITHADYKE
jgi:signal peptidase I